MVAVMVERLRLSPIFGFLLAGVAIGPQGLGLLADVDRIHQLAELGVILLMLTIGLEFSLERLRGLRKFAVIAGTLQILLSIALGMGFSTLLGWTLYQGFFLGAVIALSSTAIVFKYLLDQGEFDTPHGRIAVAFLIFQDLAVVPLMILVTGFGSATGSIAMALGESFLKVAILLSGVLLFARFVLPGFLHRVAGSKNREIFVLTAVILCLGTAYVSGQLGLSWAIGAFFAGVMFANTDYGHELIGLTVPLRHIFVSLFFVSIGLLFDVQFAIENARLVIALVGLVLITNCAVTAGLVLWFGYPPRIAFMTGILLAQIGEFAFLLLEAGRMTGSIDPLLYQLLISCTFLTMLLSPILFKLVVPMLRISERVRFFGVPPGPEEKHPAQQVSLKDHVILCGFGPVGRDLAFALQGEGIAFVIIEMNPRILREAKEAGFSVLYGDAANEEPLRRVGIDQARAVVVSFGDPIGMMQIVRLVERMNPEVLLVVRTRFEQDVPWLYELGVDVVIMEELEASLELTHVLLEHFKVDADRTRGYLKRIRSRKEWIIEEKILKQGRLQG